MFFFSDLEQKCSRSSRLELLHGLHLKVAFPLTVIQTNSISRNNHSKPESNDPHCDFSSLLHDGNKRSLQEFAASQLSYSMRCQQKPQNELELKPSMTLLSSFPSLFPLSAPTNTFLESSGTIISEKRQ